MFVLPAFQRRRSRLTYDHARSGRRQVQQLAARCRPILQTFVHGLIN